MLRGRTIVAACTARPTRLRGVAPHWRGGSEQSGGGQSGVWRRSRGDAEFVRPPDAGCIGECQPGAGAPGKHLAPSGRDGRGVHGTPYTLRGLAPHWRGGF